VPEPSGFTGKEGDEEVGLVYFGERYLIPRLGRWASPDPLHVHAVGGGEALNSYHYVGGNLLAGRDPAGLQCSPSHGNPHESSPYHLRLYRRAARRYGQRSLPGAHLIQRTLNAMEDHPHLMSIGDHEPYTDSEGMRHDGATHHYRDGHTRIALSTNILRRDDAYNTSTVMHEAFHAYVTLARRGGSSHDRNVQSFLAGGAERLSNSTVGADMHDPAEVFEETVAAYVSRRIERYLATGRELERVLGGLRSGDISPSQALGQLRPYGAKTRSARRPASRRS